eukprot:jgi/Hompol1/2937/HPOL_006236-RA
MSALRDQLQQVTTLYEAASSTAKMHEKDARQTAIRIAELRKQVAEAETRFLDLQTIFDVETSEQSRKDAKLADMQRQLESAVAKHSYLANQLQTITAAHSALQSEKDKAAEALEAAQSECAKLNTKIVAIQEQNKEAVRTHGGLRKQVRDLETRIAAMRSNELDRAFMSTSSVAGTQRSQKSVLADRDDFSSTQKRRKAAGVSENKVDKTPAVKRIKSESNASTPQSQVLREISATPGTVRKIREDEAKILICFSGFKEGTPFDSQARKNLMIAIKQMPGAEVLSSSAEGYDQRITHMIAPKNCRTLKMYAAGLMSAWLIHDINWVFDSAAKRVWLKEDKYDQKAFLAPSFFQQSKAQEYRKGYVNCLLVECSKGSIVDTVDEADFVLVGDGDQTKFGDLPSYDWIGFTTLINPKG